MVTFDNYYNRIPVDQVYRQGPELMCSMFTIKISNENYLSGHCVPDQIRQLSALEELESLLLLDLGLVGVFTEREEILELLEVLLYLVLHRDLDFLGLLLHPVNNIHLFLWSFLLGMSVCLWSLLLNLFDVLEFLIKAFFLFPLLKKVNVNLNSVLKLRNFLFLLPVVELLLAHSIFVIVDGIQLLNNCDLELSNLSLLGIDFSILSVNNSLVKMFDANKFLFHVLALVKLVHESIVESDVLFLLIIQLSAHLLAASIFAAKVVANSAVLLISILDLFSQRADKSEVDQKSVEYSVVFLIFLSKLHIQAIAALILFSDLRSHVVTAFLHVLAAVELVHKSMIKSANLIILLRDDISIFDLCRVASLLHVGNKLVQCFNFVVFVEKVH